MSILLITSCATVEYSHMQNNQKVYVSKNCSSNSECYKMVSKVCSGHFETVSQSSQTAFIQSGYSYIPATSTQILFYCTKGEADLSEYEL